MPRVINRGRLHRSASAGAGCAEDRERIEDGEWRTARYPRSSTLHLLALLLVLTALPAAAQLREADVRVHDRGELWETVKDDGTLGAREPLNPFEFFPSMDWPGGPDALASKDEQRSYHAGAGLWIGGLGANGAVFFDELGPFATVEVDEVLPMAETENFVEADGYDPGEAEETIVAEFTTTSGLRVRRTSRTWSFRGLNTFVLLDYAVTNETGGPLAGVFVGLPSLLRPSYQDINVHNGWGDDGNRTDELVAYDADRALVYAYDDTPNFDLPGDVGNYWPDRDELRTTGYAGIALLDAPPGSGGEAQPATVFWAQTLGNGPRLTTASTSSAALYAILTGTDTSLQAEDEERLTPLILLGCGPYDLGPGEAVRLAFAEAVNGLPLEVAREGLDAQNDLDAGLDSLQASIDRAAVLYEAGYRVAAVPPPAPPIEIVTLPGAVPEASVTWPPIDEVWVNPLSDSLITGYNVYRSDLGFIGPFEKLTRRPIRVGNENDIDRFFNLRLGRWQFTDNDVGLGFSYTYAVTAVDGDGNESWLTNRNLDPVTVERSAAETAMDVQVFPNPFRGRSFPTSDAANLIIFNKLPARATIRIYTASGELIRTLEHDDPNSGQEAWDQLTDARQRTAPGIYFWTVQSEVGTARGTLVIIK
ncbi:MAG: T9SS type A sorting domain-containing protein [Bacteroidota bacterium]